MPKLFASTRAGITARLFVASAALLLAAAIAAAQGLDAKFGYLPGILKALEIPVSSQVLVFSKTSFQAARIYPHNPLAIYLFSLCAL